MSQNSSAPARLTLAITSVDRLIETDSSPLMTPGLHPEAAEVLLRQADDFSPKRGYEIVLEVPSGDMERLEEVREGVQVWAEEQVRRVTQEMRGKVRKGSRALVVAMAVVALLFVLVEWMQAFGSGHLYRIFGESLIIIAWVSLWVPAETLLIEPIHLRHRRRLFAALASSKISLAPRA